MDREAVRHRIKSLLALAESDNENEALAAVQAARRLMMKYHISMGENEQKEVIKKRVVIKELRFKSIPLYRQKPVPCICFMGFEEDANAVLLLAEYLVRFMEHGAKAYGGSKSQEFCWRDGFCVGVYGSLEEQDREGTGYEIMTAIPQEVDDAFGKLKLKKDNSRRRADYRALDGAAFSSGERSGRRAVDSRSISGN